VARESQTRAVDTAASIPDRSRVPGIVRSCPLGKVAPTHTHSHTRILLLQRALQRARWRVADTSGGHSSIYPRPLQGAGDCALVSTARSRQHTHTHTHTHTIATSSAESEVACRRHKRWTQQHLSPTAPGCRGLCARVHCKVAPTHTQVGPGHPVKDVRLGGTPTSPAYRHENIDRQIQVQTNTWYRQQTNTQQQPSNIAAAAAAVAAAQ
jgi:hypothetical protein